MVDFRHGSTDPGNTANPSTIVRHQVLPQVSFCIINVLLHVVFRGLSLIEVLTIKVHLFLQLDFPNRRGAR